MGKLVTWLILIAVLLLSIIELVRITNLTEFRNDAQITKIYKFGANLNLNRYTWIYVITPTTSKNRNQKADLTRLSQTLGHVHRLHWIVVEDAAAVSHNVTSLLERSHVDQFTHLAVKSTGKFNGSRGMEQRNHGLAYLRQNKYPDQGVVYFADDDNAYDVKLFDECVRKVTSIGIWPVGFIRAPADVPILSNDGRYIESWNPTVVKDRQFPVDMSGFGVSLRLIYKTNATFHVSCEQYKFESCFLEQFGLGMRDLQPLCMIHSPWPQNEVLVWHTKTQVKSYFRNDNLGYYV